MSSRDRPFCGGGFDTTKSRRVRSFSEARSISDSGLPCTAKPGSSTRGFIDGPQSQYATSDRTLRARQYGKFVVSSVTAYRR
jgi:hypothetical protein